MWHVLKLSLTALCCLLSRWRGAPSHPASAHSWHPGRRQLSRDPWDEATSGRSHEEAGVSGTRFNCDHVHTRLHFSLWFTDITPFKTWERMRLEHCLCELKCSVMVDWCVYDYFSSNWLFLQMQIIYISAICSKNMRACSDFNMTFTAFNWFPHITRR